MWHYWKRKIKERKKKEKRKERERCKHYCVSIYIMFKPCAFSVRSASLVFLNTRNWFSLNSDAWWHIYCLIMLLVLLKSHDVLLGRLGNEDFFASLSTLWWWQLYLSALRHSQNLILFSEYHLKNSSSKCVIVIIRFWNGWFIKSKIFFAACNVSIQTSIYLIFELSSAYVRLLFIANKLASVNVMFIALYHNFNRVIVVVILLFMPVLAITKAILLFSWEVLKTSLSFCKWFVFVND